MLKGNDFKIICEIFKVKSIYFCCIIQSNFLFQQFPPFNFDACNKISSMETKKKLFFDVCSQMKMCACAKSSREREFFKQFFFEDRSIFGVQLEIVRSGGRAVSRSPAFEPTTELSLFRVHLTYFQFFIIKKMIFRAFVVILSLFNTLDAIPIIKFGKKLLCFMNFSTEN